MEEHYIKLGIKLSLQEYIIKYVWNIQIRMEHMMKLFIMEYVLIHVSLIHPFNGQIKCKFQHSIIYQQLQMDKMQ